MREKGYNPKITRPLDTREKMEQQLAETTLLGVSEYWKGKSEI